VTRNDVTERDPSFEALVTYLKDSRGFDFTGYKRSSLVRRVRRRMDQVRIGDYGEYLEYLEVHPEEFTALFNTILINVTQFFRDGEAWDYLRDEVIPLLIAEKAPDQPIRLWSAGCASGEEAYSLAIVFAETLGVEAFRSRVKIYATDVDDDALMYARQATYSEREIRGLSADIVEKYFEPVGSRYSFRKDLRRSIIFGRNDLVQDAPISRIDLLVCRNTLMYFDIDTQARILNRFHFALNPDGMLFLGKAEMLLTHRGLFTPVDLNQRVFRKAPRTINHGNGTFFSEPGRDETPDRTSLDRIREEAFLSSPTALVAVTADGLVAAASREAEAMFGVSTRDVGRPFRDLELSYRPVELRGYMEQAQQERRTLRIVDVEHLRAPGDVMQLQVRVIPLVEDGNPLGVLIAFDDVSAAARLREELQQTHRELETAYGELQSTNEELETTNEELQSTVEELETTNEELQSTNEELETMNEELQSTNDELQAINEELRDRSLQLDQANTYLESIMSSILSGVAVVDRDLRVHLWNRKAEDMWGLRSDETVGEHLLNLDIGLPLERLRPLLRSALTEANEPLEVAVPAVNRRGREITVRVVCSPLRWNTAAPTGAVLVMEEEAAPSPS
jgi:two-component system CheB/CheR fusion protein